MKYIVALLLSLILWPAFAADEFWRQGITDESYRITVYRSASCGCCKGWISHLEEHNFEVEDLTVDDVNPYKQKYNVPTNAASCHSEHNTRLLTVPAMPSGTPGMDMPGAPRQDFRVYAVSEDDQVDIFNSYFDY